MNILRPYYIMLHFLGTWGDDDDNDGSAFEDRDWMEYWRVLFKKITIADIQKYEKEYKGRVNQLEM